MSDAWEKSAAAWIASQGEAGDFTRRYVLDGPMLARIERRSFQRTLDVGCGEGRFCRLIAPYVGSTTGIDPSPSLIAEAKRRDARGDYQVGCAERLGFADHSFDLVISYLSLIDIDDIEAAITEMARVLIPGGTLLIANLNSFNTANDGRGWRTDWRGRPRDFPIDAYLDPRPVRAAWKGIDVVNWHRPMSTYMSLLIDVGLRLTLFQEPVPTGGDPAKADRYRRAPYAHIMEWRCD